MDLHNDSHLSFDGLSAYAIPFFQHHLGELSLFFKIRRATSNEPTIELLKSFIRERKMPFDMRQYMVAQSEFIRSRLSSGLSSEKRQQAVSSWIKEYAEELRDQAIEHQCQFLDYSASWIVPEIERMLKELQEHSSN